MITLERILCPIDLSANSGQALRYAIALACSYQAQLLICHCLDPVTFADESAQAEIRRRIDELIGQFGSLEAGSSYGCKVVLIEGDPIVDFTQEAARLRADLIVMHSRRRPLAAAIFGSTAEAICRDAPCPVLVTHPDIRDWDGLSTGNPHLTRVLAAHDFSTGSQAALSYALLLAQEHQAELHLMHLVPFETLGLGEAPAGEEGAIQLAKRRLREEVPAETRLWCEVKVTVKGGQPSDELLEYAERQQVDLICLGKHGAGIGITLLFGSNTDRVLRHARCPVLVAPPLEPRN